MWVLFPPFLVTNMTLVVYTYYPNPDIEIWINSLNLYRYALSLFFGEKSCLEYFQYS